MRKFIPLVLVIALLIVAVYFVFSGFSGPQKPPGETPDETLTLSELIEKKTNECLKEGRLVLPTDSRCSAIFNSDAEICKQEAEEENEKKCRRDYYLISAILKNDESPCSGIEDADNMLACKAIVGKSEADCDAVEDDFIRVACKAIVRGDIEYCNQAGDAQRCFDVFNWIAGMKTRNLGLCDKIANDGMRFECLAMAYGDLSYCKGLGCKEFVYYDLSLSKNNFSLCEKIRTVSLRDRCILDFGVNEESEEKCGMIVGSDARNACMSVINRDVELCKSVENEDHKFMCIEVLGSHTNNVSLCDELKNQTLAEICKEDLGFLEGE